MNALYFETLELIGEGSVEANWRDGEKRPLVVDEFLDGKNHVHFQVTKDRTAYRERMIEEKSTTFSPWMPIVSDKTKN